MKRLLLLLFLFSSLWAKNYHLKSIEINSQVREDGSLHVRESRTYDFNGKFHWAEFRLPLKPNMRIENFSLSENNQPFLESNTEVPGKFQTKNEKDAFYVRWFYDAQNEVRTFTLSYTITNVITEYDDIAELYFKYIGEANPTRIDRVTIKIKLPRYASFGPVKQWLHGPLWGHSQFENGAIIAQIKNMPPDQFLEARVTFPLAWVPKGQNHVSGYHHGKIMAEEERFAKESNEMRRQAQIDLAKQKENDALTQKFAILLALIGLIVFVYLYWRNGRGLTVSYNQESDPNLPRGRHPALLNCIYFNNQVSGATLATTLFSLASRGWIKIEEVPREQKKWYESQEVILHLDAQKWQNEQNKLEDFEQSLIHFIFEKIGKGKTEISSKKLKKISNRLQRWFSKWTKMVKIHLKKDQYYDPPSIKAAIISAVVNGLIMITGIVVAVTFSAFGLIMFFSGMALTALSFSIMRYTAAVKELRRHLKAVRNYLKTYAGQIYRDASSSSQFSEYFIFAIALGLGKKIIGKLFEALPETEQLNYVPWFVYNGGSSMADFAGTVCSIVNIASSSVSSAAGAGGGASAGGGAAAGGGSGGAG